MNQIEAEINVLGTGGGYGESIVIHLGNGDWIVVDSCSNPTTDESLPLKFLKERSISLDQVKLIVCTHWHDDHIAGISQLLKQCQQAIFSFARANDQKKFLQFVSLDYLKLKIISSNSSTREFNECLDVLNKTGRVAKFALPDRLLYSSKVGVKSIKIFSLSPSDKSSQLFDDEISRLITEFGPPHKKLPKVPANDRSVVLLIKIDKEVVLLGADLEVHDDPNLGWFDIILNSYVIRYSEKASYFKIPHHGSENGYHHEIWDKLVEEKPVSTMTPWNRNSKLPQPEMVQKYKSLTDKLYISSPINVSAKPKRRDRKTMKTIKEFNSSIRELRFQYGVISSMINTENPTKWDTNLSGTAQQIK